MKKSFLALPRPVVACILAETSVDAGVAAVRNGEFDGAHAFAIHLEPLCAEKLTDRELSRIASATQRPFMFLHYRKWKDDRVIMSDEDRTELLLRTIQCGATAVDFTADTFDPSPLEFTADPAAIDRQKRLIDRAHALGGEVVMSSHINEPRTCEQVLEQLTAIAARGADIVKIVTNANTDEEFAEAVKTTLALRRTLKVPFIHLVSGAYALPHRYLSPMLGNAITFCVHAYSEQFITVQPPVRNMVNILNNAAWNITLTED